MLRKIINLLIAFLGTTVVSIIVRLGSRTKVEQRVGGWTLMDFPETDA